MLYWINIASLLLAFFVLTILYFAENALQQRWIWYWIAVFLLAELRIMLQLFKRKRTDYFNWWFGAFFLITMAWVLVAFTG